VSGVHVEVAEFEELPASKGHLEVESIDQGCYAIHVLLVACVRCRLDRVLINS